MTVPAAPPQHDLYDVAFLAGGPTRVVDTAVVVLVEARRIRVPSPGQLATADLTRRHPVEAAVLDAVGPAGHRSVDTVQWRLADDDRLLAIGRRLGSAGLIGRVGLPGLRGHRRPAPTRAGRRVLRRLGRETGWADAEVARVALGGRAAMTDTRLRAEIFERPSTALVPGRPGRRSRSVDHSDPRLRAYRPGGPAPTAGGHALF